MTLTTDRLRTKAVFCVDNNDLSLTAVPVLFKQLCPWNRHLPVLYLSVPTLPSQKNSAVYISHIEASLIRARSRQAPVSTTV